MTDPLALLAVFSIPPSLVLVTVLAWKAGQATADPPPVLLPADSDTDDTDAMYVWLAEVQFDATGNFDQYVIIDRDELSKRELRQVIRDRIPGANVHRLEQERLYVPGPGAEPSAIDGGDADA